MSATAIMARPTALRAASCGNFAFSLELRRRFVISVIGRRDLVSGGLQRLGNRRADTARAAGDHCNSAHVSSLKKDVGAGTTHLRCPRALNFAGRKRDSSLARLVRLSMLGHDVESVSG